MQIYEKAIDKAVEQAEKELKGEWNERHLSTLSLIHILNNIDEDFSEKANNYAGLIKNLEVEIKALSDASKAFKERAERKAKTVDYLKENLKSTMELIGKDKVETLNAVVSFRRAQSVEIVDEGNIPEEYKKVSYTVNKAAIREVLKAGQSVSGAVLKESKSLQVR